MPKPLPPYAGLPKEMYERLLAGEITGVEAAASIGIRTRALYYRLRSAGIDLAGKKQRQRRHGPPEIVLSATREPAPPAATDSPVWPAYIAWIAEDGRWQPHVEARSAGEAFFATYRDRSKHHLPRVILRRGEMPPAIEAPLSDCLSAKC
jgi:hypothetical protein